MSTYLISDIQKSRAKTIEPCTRLVNTDESRKRGSDTPTLADTVTKAMRTDREKDHSSETVKIDEKG